MFFFWQRPWTGGDYTCVCVPNKITWLDLASHVTLQIDMRVRFRRSQEQRIVILGAEGDVKKMTITVQGTTDTYEIVAQPQSLTCSCPDAEIRKCVCKHQCVILSRVLQINFPDPLYSEPLLTEEHMAKLVTRLATWLQEQVPPNNPEDEKEIKRKVMEKDDECPICIDTLDDASPLTWCSSQCGQNFHLACLRNCLKTRENCPLCRALIKLSSLPEGKPKKIRKRKHIQDT